MSKFIEVTTDNGKWLINTAWIEQIMEEEGKAIIYFAFNIPDAYEQDYMRVKESYEEVRLKVLGGGRDG